MCCKNKGKRFCLAFLIFVGLATTFGIKVPGAGYLHIDAIFWCYLITQIPGGFLATKYPANRIFGCAIAVFSLLNLLLPVLIRLPLNVYYLAQILQALMKGLTYPSILGFWRHWAPPMERSILTTISYSGVSAGALMGWPLSELLTRVFDWEASFYCYGVFGILWSILWLWLSSEKPAADSCLSREERVYIEEAIGQVSPSTPTLRSTPWKSIFTSMPVYAIIVAHFCYVWTYNTLLSAPFLFKRHGGTNYDQRNMLGFVSPLMMTIMMPIGGLLADFSRKYFSATSVRKIFNCGGLEAVFLLMIVFNRSYSDEIDAWTGAIFFSSLAFSGFHVNHLDISPRYAGILMGISKSFGLLSFKICRSIMESLAKEKEKTFDTYQKVFLMASAVHLLGVVFYALFASGEKQPWAEPPPEDEGPSSRDPLCGDDDGIDPGTRHRDDELRVPPAKVPTKKHKVWKV